MRSSDKQSGSTTPLPQERKLASGDGVTVVSPRASYLHQLQMLADASPHTRALQSLQKMANNSATTLQRAIQSDQPKYTPDNGRAGQVDVENIQGKPYGEAHNSPSVSTFGWPQLLLAGHTLGAINSTHYNAVRMHLWNGRLDGPGNDWRNLAPGPAKINSSMSAGPESASKYAVETGKKIWLSTGVEYQNDSGQANDYTSVVPNRMWMEWGYMDPTGQRGPARPPTWDVQIPLPVNPLNQHQQQAYAALLPADTAGLDQAFQNETTQARNQAFGLVHPTLQKHILFHYPDVFENMGDAERAGGLALLTTQEAVYLIKNVLNISSPKALIKDIYAPLASAGNNALISTLYENITAPPSQDMQIIIGKWWLISKLNAPVMARLMRKYRYFRYAPEQIQWGAMDGFSTVRWTNFLSGIKNDAEIARLLKRWAVDYHKYSPKDSIKLVAANLPPKYALKYKKGLKWHLRNEFNPPPKRAPRNRRVPSRYG